MSEDPIQYGKKIMATEFNIQKRAMLEALEKSLGNKNRLITGYAIP